MKKKKNFIKIKNKTKNYLTVLVVVLFFKKLNMNMKSLNCQKLKTKLSHLNKKLLKSSIMN